MPKRSLAYIERVKDRFGIERVYGYDQTIGAKYLLNLDEVARKYEERGIRGFERCV